MQVTDRIEKLSEQNTNKFFIQSSISSYCVCNKEEITCNNLKAPFLDSNNNNENSQTVSGPSPRRTSGKDLKMDAFISDEQITQIKHGPKSSKNTNPNQTLFSIKNILKVKIEKKDKLRLSKALTPDNHPVKSANIVQTQSLPNCMFQNTKDNKIPVHQGGISSKVKNSYARLMLNGREENKHIGTQIKDQATNALHKSMSSPFSFNGLSLSKTYYMEPISNKKEACGNDSFPSMPLRSNTSIAEMINDIYSDQMKKLRCETIDTKDDKETISKKIYSCFDNTKKRRNVGADYECAKTVLLNPVDSNSLRSLETVEL